ncbi:MAG: metallophosphoesterase, partial [Cryomorphaceae bacterium]
MKVIAPGIVLILFILLVDLYTYKGLRVLTANMKRRGPRNALHILYGLGTLFSILATIWMTANIQNVHEARDYRIFFTLSGLVMLLIAPKFLFMAFHLAEDVLHVIRKVLAKPGEAENGGNGITRARFLSQIGLMLAAIPFLGMIYGMLRGRFAFRVVEQKVTSGRLPGSFDGFRIVHISDAHLGSFYGNYEAVREGFSMINALKPDMIVFTGDMVNNYADEVDGWEPFFSALQAPYGKFAVLGNHDYGDYVPWESEKEKADNLKKLMSQIRQMGFTLLMNEHLNVERNGEHITLVGVENWGRGRFARYGDLNRAMKDVPQHYKILLSHDPSHWDAQVLGQTDIDLTLSGHTHGMQFGIEVPGIKWSPVQYRYPRWGGLYREGKQHLYVNRGFGYIGFPG